MKKILASFVLCFMCMACIMPIIVNAETNFLPSFQLPTAWSINKDQYGNFYQIVPDSNSSGSWATDYSKEVYCLYYNDPNHVHNRQAIFWSYESGVGVGSYSSKDKVIASYTHRMSLSSSYTYTNLQGESFSTIYYATTSWFQETSGSWDALINYKNTPFISLPSGQDMYTILAMISQDSSGPYPWNGTYSDGGRYFSDGLTLSPEDNAKYEQVYIVMDVDQDNSVSQAEVSYYNATYNTNYDYSVINEGNNFNELEFLHWVAVEIDNGNDNPGGGTGSGGTPDGSGGGGVVVTDSFQQQQYQTIEENAVNVTVNNNNEVSQENVNLINQIVNDISGEDRNAFNQSVSAVTWASEYIGNFSSLVSAVLGFLPPWITTILSIIFGMMLLCIVLRLLHLFV